MRGFDKYLTESKAEKNLHLEHIEDVILDFGVIGGRSAINFIQDLRDMLAGQSKSKVNLSVKWDGAPALFAGVDPEDGKFFVGTKGVFNVSPKLVKSPKDVNQFSSGLQDKLLIAFDVLSKIGIKGVIQGDMMYTNSDLSTTNIDGQSYLTFQPNTIVYAIPADSNFAAQIKATKMGIVWHTTYSGGPTLQDMTASFGADISGLKKSTDVWFDDATYKDVSGSVLFNAKETAEVTRHLSRAGKVFQRINSKDLKKFLDFQKYLQGSTVGSSFKTYNNTLVRKGEYVKNSRAHTRGYSHYFKKWWEEKIIGKVKQTSTKDQKTKLMKEYIRLIRSTEATLQQVVEFQGHIVQAKNLVINKLDSGAGRMSSTFVRTADGYQVTPDEGYVAVDRTGGAVKLVDRLTFSHNNFNAIKSWSK